MLFPADMAGGRGASARRAVPPPSNRDRLDETFAVEHNAAAQPICIRVSSGHDKHVSNALIFGFIGLIVSPGDSFQVVVAFEFDKLCMGEKGDMKRMKYDRSESKSPWRFWTCGS